MALHYPRRRTDRRSSPRRRTGPRPRCSTRVLAAAEAAGAEAHAVDLSADFRFADPERFARDLRPGARRPRAMRGAFVCAVPEHYRGRPPGHAAQPGCFTTAVVLAAYPLYALGLASGDVFVSAVTGSSGSGRTPARGDPPPGAEREPLRATRRSRTATSRRCGCCSRPPAAAWSRRWSSCRTRARSCAGSTRRCGCSSSSRCRRRRSPRRSRSSTAAPRSCASPPTPPRLNEVVGTNACRLGVATRGRTAVVTSVIDNLVKGAAGGGVQWMNRLLGFDEDAGLRLAGIGWH